MQMKYLILETLYKVCQHIDHKKAVAPAYINDPDEVSRIITKQLINDNPCMIARLGANEIQATACYLGKKKYRGINHVLSYLRNETPRWWWTDKQIKAMELNAGFFHASEERLTQFAELMTEDMKLVDILGSWLPEERWFKDLLSQAVCVRLRYLEPFWAAKPWTACLKGKRVLVVHPFAKSIERQYERREELFSNPDLLPAFASLRTIKAVQSIGNETGGFDTWFDALKWMEDEMDKEPYDVALIGCGAYGFPLAAHAKRTGHKAVHLGGALQLLFGIKGKRWFSPDGDVYDDYHHLLRPSWVWPEETDKPKHADDVEGGCYW
jgi:hypothetical protein